MDALIATFVEEYKQRIAMFNEDPEGNLFNDGSSEADGEKDLVLKCSRNATT